MTYRYDVLGTTRAFGPDGAEVPISGARMRALLTALAAAGGRPVPADRLAAQVWDDAPELPADEAAALQALIGRLRKALGGAAIESVPGGYRLVAARDDIDVFRFEQLAAEGASALAGGDGGRAAVLLDEALALWRGPALTDLPGGETDPLGVRARRQLTEARRARLTADVRLGRPERALPGLAALAAGAPLDEPLQATRIGALRAAGRRAEALQVYDEVRALLADRLGTGPGQELRSLHAELLADDENDARRHQDPAAAPAALPGNLPARLTSFVGRESELAVLCVELPARRLITLTGPGGAERPGWPSRPPRAWPVRAVTGRTGSGWRNSPPYESPAMWRRPY